MAICGAKLEPRAGFEEGLKISETSNHEGKAQMSRISIAQADFDYNTPLVLELNEITSLMAISSLGIITVMVLSVVVAASAFLSKTSQDLSQEHFTRS
jgi:hypothetical protein